MDTGVYDEMSPVFAQHTAVNHVGRNEIAFFVRHDVVVIAILDRKGNDLILVSQYTRLLVAPFFARHRYAGVVLLNKR